MKNREFYQEQLLDIACSGSAVALVNNAPVACKPYQCAKCECKDGDGCSELRLQRWSEEEYIEEVDWNEVEVDTPLLVRNTKTGEWQPRLFAFYNRGTVYTFERGMSSKDSKNVLWWNFAKLDK